MAIAPICVALTGTAIVSFAIWRRDQVATIWVAHARFAVCVEPAPLAPDDITIVAASGANTARHRNIRMIQGYGRRWRITRRYDDAT